MHNTVISMDADVIPVRMLEKNANAPISLTRALVCASFAPCETLTTMTTSYGDQSGVTTKT